jgi:hypothetical protein
MVVSMTDNSNALHEQTAPTVMVPVTPLDTETASDPKPEPVPTVPAVPAVPATPDNPDSGDGANVNINTGGGDVTVETGNDE